MVLRHGREQSRKKKSLGDKNEWQILVDNGLRHRQGQVKGHGFSGEGCVCEPPGIVTRLYFCLRGLKKVLF